MLARPGSKNQKPKVDTQIDFHGLLLKDAEKRLPGMVEDKLQVAALISLLQLAVGLVCLLDDLLRFFAGKALLSASWSFSACGAVSLGS